MNNVKECSEKSTIQAAPSFSPLLYVQEGNSGLALECRAVRGIKEGLGSLLPAAAAEASRRLSSPNNPTTHPNSKSLHSINPTYVIKSPNNPSTHQPTKSKSHKSLHSINPPPTKSQSQIFLHRIKLSKILKAGSQSS